ncbi:hypothetical protein ILUMI_01747 [Ignelater luminosus]|uniref:Uncharacterized protein n=1 Tax=Ignelater luminosus TaxID=2038154 RepID=A0A8K0GJY2_IGNLU|nr:hypothetical protein ILUMI_01747 [Ignelater luminosus]
MASRRSIHRTSTVSLLKQQRRGTNVPRKKSVMEDMSMYHPSSTTTRDSVGHLDVSRRLSWLEKVRRRSVVLGTKGRVIMEARFSPDYRGIYSTRFSPDGESFVTAYGAGAIQVWHLDTEQHNINVRSAPDHGFPIMCIRFPRNQDATNFFAAGACGTLFWCGMRAGDYHDFAREEPNEINSVDVNSSETVATGGKDAAIRLYDINTKQLKGKFSRDDLLLKSEEEDMKFHKMRIFSVRFHPTMNEVLISGGWDDSVKIWDLREKDGCVRDIRGPHICGDALDIRDKVVLTGSWAVENSLQTWDLRNASLIENINPVNRPKTIDGEFLYCCQFFNGDSLGNTVIVGGSGLGSVEVIDIPEKKIMSSYRVHKTIQAIDSTDRYVVFGGMESTFRIATV